MTNTILTDAKARAFANKMLRTDATNYKTAPKEKGYFRDGTVFVAFDNSCGEMWVEEFKTKKRALDWLYD